MEVTIQLWEIKCHMGSHSGDFHTFTPAKLVLDLTTMEAESTWVVVISHDVYPRNMVVYLRNNSTMSWLGIEPMT